MCFGIMDELWTFVFLLLDAVIHTRTTAGSKLYHPRHDCHFAPIER